MTCVEIPSDRRLKKRITDGEYADCTHWAEGESRRWKYGWGKGGEGEGEEEYEGGISKKFRWRKWKGLEKELRRELTRRGEMNDADQEGKEDVAMAGPSQGSQRVKGEPSAYSVSQTRAKGKSLVADDSLFRVSHVINVVESQKSQK